MKELVILLVFVEFVAYSAQFQWRGFGGGRWTQWSQWTPCSRPCGGGTTSRRRTCDDPVNKRNYPQFILKIYRQHHRGSCQGPDVEYRTCNLQDCPIERQVTRNDAITSRAHQCAKFNGTSFNGYYFNWVPYIEVSAVRQCELYCLAKGHRFFLKLQPKVKDGTPCLSDVKKICIDGTCQDPPNGCDDGKCFIVPERKPKQKIFGIFTSKQSKGKLVLGYNAVITIPKGSTKINITEMQQSKNYLALKAHNKDKYYLNGNWVIDLPRGYKIAGANFYYKRPKRSQKFNEAIFSEGPTVEPLDVMIIYQGDEPNIMYSYYLPEGFPQDTSRVPAQPNYHRQTNNRRRDYNRDTLGLERGPNHKISVPLPGPRPDENQWKLAGFTRCSSSCAGGKQATIYHCVRVASNTRVQESVCNPSKKPSARQRVCNIQPCPPRWIPGKWLKCSKTCGEGIQIRNLRCKQVIDENGQQIDKMLPIKTCPQWSRPPVTRPCKKAPCPVPSKWVTEDWGQCSVTCGIGVQNRKIICINIKTNATVNKRHCQRDKRPVTAKSCNRGSCETYWFRAARWSQCSVECGKGQQHRPVFCGRGSGASLPLSNCKTQQPSSSRPCNKEPCQASWMMSEWSKCSVECGQGEQTRSVFCAGKVGGMYQEYPIDACPIKTKPKATRKCHNENCPPQWYASDWKPCSKTCGGGSHSRQIVCLNYKGERVGGCENDSRPPYLKRCNTSSCPGSIQSARLSSNCKDTSPTLCNIVIRANFCRYSRYNAMCCKSCSNSFRKR